MKRLTLAIVALFALMSLVAGGPAARAVGPAPRTPVAVSDGPAPPAAVPALPETGVPFVDALSAPAKPESGPPKGKLPANRGNGHKLPEIVPGAFAAYGTGTPIYADALETGGRRLADVEVAFSGASFSSNKMSEGLVNEMQRVVAPALDPRSGFGRGSGFELGLGIGSSERNQLILADLAESAAPPSVAKVTKQIGPIVLDPIAKATLLRGQALSRVANGCTLGSDLSYGLGYAADLNLLDLGDNFVKALVKTSADKPERSVTQSSSRTRLVPRDGAKWPEMRFGLLSETRETIAPVTFFAGTEHQFTVEVLGEWVLRGRADGKDGSLFYGPADTSPETPILRILDRDNKVTTQLTFQNLLGKSGLEINIPGVAEIVLGEDPRAIGGDASSDPTHTGTVVLGAVDVVRVRLLAQGDSHLADVRLGHMEVGLAVPADGIRCAGIGMALRAEPPKVKPGNNFDWVVTVSNPNDCKLNHVKLVDTIKATDGVKYDVVSSEPKADSVDKTKVIFEDIGSLDPGQSKDVHIKMKVAGDSATGRFTDEAFSSGMCGPAAAEGEAGAAAGAEEMIPFEGHVTLDAPEVELGLIRTIGLAKRAEPKDVKPGDAFNWIISVSNPNDCVLTKVKIVDTITTTEGVKYDIGSTEPKADAIDAQAAKITFEDIGGLTHGESKDLLIHMKVSDKSSSGVFTDNAVATGLCGPAYAQGEAGATGGVDGIVQHPEPSEGKVSLEGPTVGGVLTAAGLPSVAAAPAGGGTPGPAGSSAQPTQVLPAAGALAATGGIIIGLMWPLTLLGTGRLFRRLGKRSAGAR